MKLVIAAILLAAPAQAAPPTDVFCTDLRALAVAAEEAPPFASLGGTSLRSLLDSYCVVPPTAVAFLCTRSLLPRHIGAASLIERMRQCLPGLRVTDNVGYRETRVEHGRLRIDVTESGGERAHVGRIVTIYISAEAAQPPAG